MNDRYYDFLEWLIGHKFAKKLKISTLTNATKIPDHIFQYKKAFKRLSFMVSVDGIGKKDEYIEQVLFGKRRKRIFLNCNKVM